MEVAHRELTRCAWCGRPFGADAVRLTRRTRCAGCGASTTDPWPSEAELERAYGSWYRPASGRFAFPGDAILRRTRALLARRIDAIAPPGPVLDVGAGEGVLVRALRSRGRAVLGLEREERPPEVLDKSLDEVDGEWAAVVFWHSLEHLREPGADLERAAKLLAPGGMLFVAVPNIESLQARVFAERWLALDLPRHLAHVPARGLVARLGQLGLRVERVSHLRGGQVAFGWLHGLVGALPGRPSLYDAIRTPAAREHALSPARRLQALAAGATLLPVALLLAVLEAVVRRGGTVYVEARCVG